MVWFCRMKLFIHVHEIMTVRLYLGISFSDPIWYKNDDSIWASSNNWITCLKSRVTDSFWFCQSFLFVLGSANVIINFRGYSTQVACEILIHFRDIGETSINFCTFFSFIVILRVCVYPKNLQLLSMSPVAVQ